MNGGLFQHNTSTNSAGGGLWASSTLALTGMQFLSNTAAGAGGGAVALGAASVIGGLFQNNTSTSYAGGGLYAGSTLALTGTQFLSNTATSDGGGLYHSAGPGRVVNALFALNRAGGNGADLALHSPGQVVILHTTLANPASGGGAAIDIVAGTLGITDTIIANHTIGISNTGGLVFEDYNLFFGNRNSTTGSIAGGAHDVVDDPMFVDPAYDNYHLKPGSAAIDRGVAAGVPFDIDGDPRPFGAGYDIGYDEWVNYPIYLPLVLRNY
jgi:predicted outer membrane repeat protein